jgi:hypothetical protein
MNKKIMPVSSYILSYLFWAVSIVVGFWVLLDGRDAILSLASLTTYNRNQSNASDLFYKSLQLRAADVWSYLAVGILAIVMIVYLEFVYRNSVQNNQMWARFSMISAIELGLLALAGIITAIVTAVVSSFSWRSLFQPISILLLAVGLYMLWQKLKQT